MPDRLRASAAGVAVCLVAAIAVAGCGGGGSSGLKVSTDPKLYPEFAAGVTDYVSRCRPGQPLRVTIDAPGDVSVSLHGARARGGRFTSSVPVEPGQDANLVARSKAGARRYHIRCLPPDFPIYSFKRFGPRPAARWYLLAPVTLPDTRFGHYVMIVDTRGTPVWWTRTPEIPFDSRLWPGRRIVWARWYQKPFAVNPNGAWEVHRLDGRLLKTLQTSGSPTDPHDIELLPNGHYLVMTYKLRRHVDVRVFKGPRDGNVVDGEIQELSPSGRVVWRWDAIDHIKLSENVHWRFAKERLPDGTLVYDWFHLNSFEPDGDGLLVSARQVDAVYRISRRTGDVIWKLGGSPRKESLHVVGDERREPFIGQHDVRLLPDGTLTVFDNHTFFGVPRAVRFAIDTKRRTATRLDEVTEPSLKYSAAEGNAQRLPNGHWVVSWGATKLVSERTSSNRPVWLMTLAGAQNFHVQAILAGQLPAAVLRRSMDRLTATALRRRRASRAP